jgi:hypothetical protein
MAKVRHADCKCRYGKPGGSGGSLHRSGFYPGLRMTRRNSIGYRTTRYPGDPLTGKTDPQVVQWERPHTPLSSKSVHQAME